MHIHILGIGGTFMGGVALLARALGHRVTGSDAKVYPPMSTQLESQGIALLEGYDPAHLEPAPDLVIIGNALTRGNAAVEAVLDRGLRYTSGAQWVAEQVLADRWVLAVAGTHGKTTTTSMLAWILDDAKLKPGFLVGGVPENFGVSARLGDAPFFVIEADEYDTAFFDKRSKFVHYRPRTAILNNLEFDHADIFPDVDAIQRQFHHLVRTVPRTGLLLVNAGDPHLSAVLGMGCWTPVERFGDRDGWHARLLTPDGSRFEVYFRDALQGTVAWELMGTHNVLNALAAIGAARHAGVPAAVAIEGLASFRNVKRRLELRGNVDGVAVYDDFAHHPTAIAVTVAALRARIGGARLVAVLEARSSTMRMGVHREQLAPALAAADAVVLLQPPDLKWDMGVVLNALPGKGRAYTQVDAIVDALATELRAGDHVLIMSNGGFDGIHNKLLARLRERTVRRA
jgi:UDP-N-acetylmuramate: L-alanyl-gamma-D-glutamyl-meso-diaminopimelate ligase